MGLSLRHLPYQDAAAPDKEEESRSKLTVLAGEQRLALQHLGEDTSSAPNVHSNVVLLPGQHDFRRAVVARRNIAGHLGVLDTRKTEVANLEVTVLVDEDVRGLQVTVDDAGRVDVLQSTEDLVQEVLDELLLQWPRRQEAVQVGTKQLRDEVDVLEGGDEDVAERDDLQAVRQLPSFCRYIAGASLSRKRPRLYSRSHDGGASGA